MSEGAGGGPPVWLFGYGSLLWRPDFPFAERRPGWIEGFTRRFWQGSTDHRGLPGAPGRVVTLVEQAGARCGGLAYRLAPDAVEETLAALDHRERGGYRRLEVRIAFRAAPEGPATAGAADPGVRGLLYLATRENPNYLGPASLDAIAAQAGRARGPSGTNREYVERLAGALESLGFDDEHVFAVRDRLGRSPGE